MHLLKSQYQSTCRDKRQLSVCGDRTVSCFVQGLNLDIMFV